MASAGGAAFTVKPRVGLLRKDESRLLVFRFSPSEQRIYEQALKCAFNSSAANSYVGRLEGEGNNGGFDILLLNRVGFLRIFT